MILCSCNVLSRAALLAAAEKLRSADPSAPVTPGRVFHALGVRPQCGSCVELVRRTLRDGGFPGTCPEPIAVIADQVPAVDEEEWDRI
jgi:bacterioferritin-associated ferredoxin